jgi:hypothetical protein
VPAFIPISFRMGPFTTAIEAMALELLLRAVTPVAPRARMTGKYSGRAPAMTAFTATFSTVNSQYSRKCVERMRPTTSPGPRLVPASMAATRSSVGRTMGSLSVQLLSRKSWWRLSSVSGSRSLGVERSNSTGRESISWMGWVSPSTTSCMTGRPVMGSTPSI